MANQWTEEQKQVIWLRNRNILVSAAAGSGKTAVLVERILQKITDKEHPVDIDRLLIVTFTRAAAAEMRERIGTEIQKRLMEDPDNENLQRQETLLFHAQITTIDSFCQSVLRSYFHLIDLDPMKEKQNFFGVILPRNFLRISMHRHPGSLYRLWKALHPGKMTKI